MKVNEQATSKENRVGHDTNENFKFRICIMILESLIQAIFCLDFLFNIQYRYRWWFLSHLADIKFGGNYPWHWDSYLITAAVPNLELTALP